MKRCRLSQLGLNLASEKGQISVLAHAGSITAPGTFLPLGQSHL